MRSSIKRRDAEIEVPESHPDSFKPIDRNAFSENALSLLDLYRVDNANDPMAIFVSLVDKMSANQREVISRFESAIALAGVEFGRIDLAIEKAEETQRHAEELLFSLKRTQKDFASITDKILRRSNTDIVLNHLKPCIYVLLGAILTLLVVFVRLHLKIL